MRPILPFLLLALPLLGGCLGGGDDSSEQVSGNSESPTDSGTTPGSTEPGVDEPEPVVPKYHGHDYWGGRQEVFLFNEFPVRLAEDVPKETIYRDNAVVVGYKQFDTRMDGDDSSASDKADTVFQGTKALVLRVDWTEAQNIKGLTFYYKPANSPRFSAIPDVKAGQDYTIGLGKGWADMAHQLSLSRWRFALEAFDPDTSSLPFQPHLAQGEAKVTLRAINGGESFLDPPHPYFFLDRDERYAGQINKTVDSRIVNTTATQLSNGDPLSGWKAPAPYIVPWDANLVRVWLNYTYTGTATNIPHELGLVYTDASGTEVKYPVAAEKTATTAYYEIPVLSHQADGPYHASSDWTWGVYPIVNGERNYGGDFKGDVAITIHAKGHSDPSTMEG